MLWVEGVVGGIHAHHLNRAAREIVLTIIFSDFAVRPSDVFLVGNATIFLHLSQEFRIN